MHRRKQTWLILCALCVLAVVLTPALLLDGSFHAASTPKILLPQAENGFRFAVIGDSGTGDKAQYAIGQLLTQCWLAFPFDTVLMLGDNLYGSEGPRDYQRKFELPYKVLLDGGVKFYAALGNHDDPTQRLYKPFNMNERRFYTFQPKDGMRFFALDSTYMSAEQLEWLEKELKQSESGWKICFFHHPIYSSGKRHGSDIELRGVLEPLFVKYGVDAVFAGHEHFYERIRPQNGVAYFVSGAAGKLRRGNIAQGGMTAKGFDQDYSFILFEIAGDEMYFQTIALSGQTVDQGSIRRREAVPLTGKSTAPAELFVAAAQGRVERLNDLVAQGADVNARDKRRRETYGFTPLMWASMHGQARAARRLLALGADIEARDEADGATALMRATDNGRVEVARILLKGGADPNAHDRLGWTALMGSARQGDSFMAEFLLEQGADVNRKRPADGADALMCAVEAGNLMAVETLIAGGADTRSRDSAGRTALMRAVEGGRTDIVKVLIEADADPDQADRKGVTALHKALQRRNAEVVRLLQKDRGRRSQREHSDALPGRNGA